MNENTLAFGDNLQFLRQLQKEGIKVQLIYIDPPFASGQNYFLDQKKLVFSDKFSREELLEILKPRLKLMHSILSETGSLFVHCDFHLSHYLKVMLDGIFNNQFVNEIIWRRMTGTKNNPKKKLPNITDSILWYRKTANFKFHPIYFPLSKERISAYRSIDASGRRYTTGSRKKGARSYLDQTPGTPLTNLWQDIFNVLGNSAEREKFQTQKPVKLLERIIRLASDEGDLIADFFVGSGTTLIAAERLNRRWLGCDISPLAIQITRKRLDSTLLNRKYYLIEL